MSTTVMVFHLLMERLSRRERERTPEPCPVMDSAAQVDAFAQGGTLDGVLPAIYLYHAMHASSVIKPGDRVLDLACGPANQLVQFAQLNPGAHFVGLDASPKMLEAARALLTRSKINNVELVQGDMSAMDEIGDATMDCVTCTMALHHLPDLDSLAQMMQEARRVLKPGGGVYFADFGRLKRASTMRYFANERRESQSTRFTCDFLHSLAAAFSIAELRETMALLGPGIELHATPLAPFMAIITSRVRHEVALVSKQQAQILYRLMTPDHQGDFNALGRWFSAGGLHPPCRLD
jgi:SAM-dependent methyltransferase